MKWCSFFDAIMTPHVSFVIRVILMLKLMIVKWQGDDINGQSLKKSESVTFIAYLALHFHSLCMERLKRNKLNYTVAGLASSFGETASDNHRIGQGTDLTRQVCNLFQKRISKFEKLIRPVFHR